MSENNVDISSSPGLILKTAREELNLSIDHVAHDLHLRSSVVQSLEQEHYDAFNSDVFLKGYFRSYCRLVNLHEERMVDLLEKQLASRQSEIASVALNAKKAESAQTRKKIFKVMAVLAVVGGISVYVLGFLLSEKDSVEAENTKGMNAKQILESKLDLVEKAPVKPGADDPVSLAPKALKEAKPVDPVELTDATSSGQPVPVDTPTVQKASEPEVKELAAQAERTEQIIKTLQIDSSVSSAVPENKYVDAVFSAEFTADCWFKFTNGKGKTVYAALKRKGDKVNYTGPAPFSVVLGDARQAIINLDGDLVNLKPYTAKNGRAQLELKPNN